MARSVAEPEQFAVLYDRYVAMLLRYAGRRVGPADAEDVVAAAFLAAFRGRSRYDRSRTDARPWLFGILTKEISRRRRTEEARLRALARAGPEMQTAVLDDQIADDVTARAARRPLAAALATLTPDERSVLLLIGWAELSYIEVSQALGVPVGTVRSRLHRARRKVRAAFGDVDPMTLADKE